MKMKQPDPSGDLNLRKVPSEMGRGICEAQPAGSRELPGCLATKWIKRDPDRGRAKEWEGQWQEFLKAVDPPHSIRMQRDSGPWEDAKTFLASFEQVAEACQWPRTEWVAQLLPALSGEAKEAFSSLEARDQEDYGKVKAAILRGEALKMETQRQHFRQFRFQEIEDPRKVYSCLQELCRQWLKPERRTKEQILELLVLEQFLAILPAELQSWIRECGPENCVQTAVLAEDFLMSQQESETWKWQVPASSKESVGNPLSPVKRLLLMETKERESANLGLAQKDDEMIPCHLLSSLPPEGQELVESRATEGSVDFELAVHFTEGEWALLDPGQRVLSRQLLPDGHESGTSLDHVSAIEIKEEMFQPEGPELVGHHKMVCRRSYGDVPVKPMLPKGGVDLDNTQEINLPRRRLCEEMQAVNQQTPHKNERKHTCPECGKEFHYRSQMIKHQMIHTGIKPYQCLVCQKNFQRKDNLFAHQKIHTGEKPHRCLKCEKSFYNQGKLFRHQRVHTGEKLFSCPDCEKCFPGQEKLLAHQAIHAGERSYDCAEHGRGFGERIWLHRHQRTHTGEKGYECHLCQKNFRRKGNLTAHQKTHTGERPYVCSQCGKAFSEKAKLIRHERVHTGEKPYLCPTCHRSFNQRETLLRHQRVHTGEKPYACLECGDRFGQKETLLRHQKIHAGRKIE